MLSVPDIALLLLGNPELHVRNRRIDVGVKRMAALAYLALNGTTRRRTLAELLWPDSDNPLNNLAVARNDLSRILGADGLEVDAQTIGLGPAVKVDL
jgi:DNA-binding SARP family transcriptional activator